MAAPDHYEVLVEEPSMEAFLRLVLPKVVRDSATFEVYTHQGKSDLLAKLPARLRGYAAWLPDNWRIVVVVDRDDDNCLDLKGALERVAGAAQLKSRTAAGAEWQVLNRIAIEELEAWYFGEWEAVRDVYPRVSERLPQKAAYRDPDDIRGGTWEAFERELQRADYFSGGLRKIEAARAVGRTFQPERCSSASFQCMARTLAMALKEEA